MTDSLTNLQVVEPKGPKVFAAVLVLAAMGGVAWYFLGREPGPIGEPEDPAKVLMIGTDDPASSVLEQTGFSVKAMPMHEAASAGRTAASPDDDVAAVLHFADIEGYGYVAFSGASDIDFGARAVSPDSAEIGEDHRYAVFSVGDLATPTTKVTVDPNPKLYDVPPHAELLQALFGQDKLAATLVGENNLSMEARPLFERIRPAVELKGAYGLLDQKAAGARRRLQEYVIDEEEAEPRPALLTRDVERGHAFALANGEALLLLDAPVLRETGTTKVSLEWTGDTRAWSVELTSGERTRCEAGDRIRPDVRVEAGGRVLIAPWGARDLMVFTVDPKSPGCALEAAGTIAREDGDWGHADGQGRVVRASAAAESIAAEIHTPDDPHPQVWPLAGCGRGAPPIWIDDRHIATTCQYEAPDPALADVFDEAPAPADTASEPVPDQLWIYLLSIEDGSVLALPIAEGADVDTYPRDLLLRAGTDALTLVGTRPELTTYTFTTSISQLFEDPPLDPDRPRPAFVRDAAAGVRALAPDTATVGALAIEGAYAQPLLSPDGASMALEVDTLGEYARNLAIYDFGAGRLRRVAIDEWARHGEPSFTPEGRTVVFNSRYSLRSEGRATVPQVVTLPAP